MKNMKIKAKLIMGFAIVAAIAAFIGGLGTVMLLRNDASYSNILVSNNQTLMSLADLRENYQMERVFLRNVVIAVPNGAAAVDKAIADFTASSQLVSASFADYEKTIQDKNREAAFYTARDTYEGAFTTAVNTLLAAARNGDYTAAAAELSNTAAAAAPIASGLAEIVKVNDQLSAESAATLKRTSTITAVTVVSIAIASVLISLMLGLYIAKIIGTPTKAICDTLNIIGQTGSLTFPADIVSITEETSKYSDELGQSASALNGLTKRLSYISEQLDLVAGGDLTSDIKLASDSDVMGLSLKKMSDGLNSMFAEINSSTNQVSTGSTQIADGAQMLAQGATEQSATVEELSASIAEISEQTKQNAGLANDARELGEHIKLNAEKGNGQMEQMIKAVGEISDASQSIGKVIKIIDDIAFQTNILALNAAVEAARAGQHGKGFAVVADEVRSLAAKSAEAAKNTSELIATSIQKSEMGAAISQETAESLKQIVEGILKSSALVADIATSSNQQATSISQVSEGIEQVSQVVQQNSATAEESAAASEQMSGQATLLQQLISQFKLKNSSRTAQSFSSPAKPAAVPVRTTFETGFAMSGDSKY